MTETVKVTQEQADWLDKYGITSEAIDYAIDIQPYKKRPDSPIVEWSSSKLARAFYAGYEVKETFEIGDFVYVGWHNGAGVYEVEESRGITTLTGKPAIKIYSDGNNIAPIEITRHATPDEIAEEKQRRWWKKHGRQVWELKKGDLIQGTFGQVREVYRVNEVGEYATLPNYTSFSKKDLAEWKIICFAEDRKDLEGQA